jgi:ribosome-associated heat shock protein Hsp15
LPDRPEAEAAVDRLRIDKWLWHARFCKTRVMAATIVTKKRVRVNRVRVSKASYQLKVGDVLTLPRGDDIAVVRVLAFGTRRGPATEGQTLYEELTPDG